jgi:DNA-binding beta-propeller fold protein YncE
MSDELPPSRSFGAVGDAVARPHELPPATHHGELSGEIDVKAPDGARRVPFSVAVEASGATLVFSFLATGESVIDRFDASSAFVATVARFAVGSARGQLLSPAGVALDGGGRLMIPDAERNVILRCEASSTGFSVVDELAGDGDLQGPRDVDSRADGTLVVADTENHRVQVWSPSGEVIASWGAEANEDDESRYLPSGRGHGEFFRPLGVTFDAKGRAWVADTNNHRVQRLSVEHGFELAFGVEGAAAGQMRFPIDVRIDDAGHVVVADDEGKRIQWFTQEGALVAAMLVAEAIPPGASIADVDVDGSGDVLIPVGPLARVYRARRGGAL